jgi:hypothetical protein
MSRTFPILALALLVASIAAADNLLPQSIFAKDVGGCPAAGWSRIGSNHTFWYAWKTSRHSCASALQPRATTWSDWPWVCLLEPPPSL